MNKKYIQPGYDEFGREIPDPTPVEMPIGFQRPPSLHETIQRLVRNELSEAAASHGYETFEEADDFGEDDDEPLTPFEVQEMQAEVPAGELAERVEREYDRRTGKRPVDKESDDGSGIQQTGRTGVGEVHPDYDKRDGEDRKSFRSAGNERGSRGGNRDAEGTEAEGATSDHKVKGRQPERSRSR